MRCLNLALGETPGEATFHRSDFTYSSSLLPMTGLHADLFPQSKGSREVVVRVDRLDDAVAREGLPPPDFVKLDVQGFEDRVLRGGAETIRRARHCMLEMSYESLYEGSLLFDDIYDMMRGLGFRVAGVAGQIHGNDGRPVQADVVFRNANRPGRTPAATADLNVQVQG